jgi:sugar phosphate isomerase/epimerase
MKFAICNEIFENWQLEDAMQFAARAGYDAIEIAPFTIAKNVNEISSLKRKSIREAAARNKILISGIHWVLVQTQGFHLTHPDENIRCQTSKYFSDLVNFCADIGGGSIVVGSPKQRNIAAGGHYEQAWDWATDIFREPVMKAEERGVIICFEPLAPSETNFINTAEEAVRFVGQLNTPHFKIILDVKAMCSEVKPIPQIIRESWPHFAHFHANDKNLKGPGFGEVDFDPIAMALKEVGYNKFVSVEVFNFEEGPELIATKSFDTLKRAFRKK